MKLPLALTNFEKERRISSNSPTSHSLISRAQIDSTERVQSSRPTLDRILNSKATNPRRNDVINFSWRTFPNYHQTSDQSERMSFDHGRDRFRIRGQTQECSSESRRFSSPSLLAPPLIELFLCLRLGWYALLVPTTYFRRSLFERERELLGLSPFRENFCPTQKRTLVCSI